MTKNVAKIGLVAALYTILTLAVSPIAFGPLQLRLGELLKPLALGGPVYIYGLTIGLIVANLFSPFAGIWEIAIMPLSCLIGGWIAYRLRKIPLLSVLFYALWVSLSVGAMLHFVVGLPWFATSSSIALSEIPLFLVGWQIGTRLLRCPKV